MTGRPETPDTPALTAGSHPALSIKQGYHGRRPRTWATITAEGRHALRHELASMQALMERLDSADSARGH